MPFEKNLVFKFDALSTACNPYFIAYKLQNKELAYCLTVIKADRVKPKIINQTDSALALKTRAVEFRIYLHLIRFI